MLAAAALQQNSIFGPDVIYDHRQGFMVSRALLVRTMMLDGMADQREQLPTIATNHTGLKSFLNYITFFYEKN